MVGPRGPASDCNRAWRASGRDVRRRTETMTANGRDGSRYEAGVREATAAANPAPVLGEGLAEALARDDLAERLALLLAGADGGDGVAEGHDGEHIHLFGNAEQGLDGV